MPRVESLLLELQARHRNQDPRFLEAVRPMAERILDPTLSDAARVQLLELLAETFERDVQIRAATAASLVALRAWVANMKRLLGLQ